MEPKENWRKGKFMSEQSCYFVCPRSSAFCLWQLTLAYIVDFALYQYFSWLYWFSSTGFADANKDWLIDWLNKNNSTSLRRQTHLVLRGMGVNAGDETVADVESISLFDRVPGDGWSTVALRRLPDHRHVVLPDVLHVQVGRLRRLRCCKYWLTDWLIYLFYLFIYLFIDWLFV